MTIPQTLWALIRIVGSLLFKLLITPVAWVLSKIEVKRRPEINHLGSTAARSTEYEK